MADSFIKVFSVKLFKKYTKNVKNRITIENLDFINGYVIQIQFTP